MMCALSFPGQLAQFLTQPSSSHIKMKFLLALLALPAVVFTAEYSAEEYRSGEVHTRLMHLKNVSGRSVGR